MKIGRGYIPGDYWAICDRCGFEYRNSRLVTEEWTGLRVCRKCEDDEPVYPTQRPDDVAVPIPRPENDGTAYPNEGTSIVIGLNLFPDPNILPANDGLWSQGINSQIHAKTEYYSKKLDGINANITVTGLEAGEVYRLMASVWTYDNAAIRLNGVDTGIFEDPQHEAWYTDIVYFTPTATSIVLTFVGSPSRNWYDDIHVQKYTKIVTTLTPAEIIANKKVQDSLVDNTVEGNVIEFFAFYEDKDFNSLGFDVGIFTETDSDE